MTTISDKNAPAGATNTNEGNKNFEERSVTTAYLSYNPDNTRHTFGTWSGDDLAMKDHITIIVPMKTAQRMYADGPQLIGLNRACAEKQSREVHLLREEQRAKKREERRRQLSNEIEGELFSEELAAIDAQADAIYSQIEKLVDERLAAGQQEKES